MNFDSEEARLVDRIQATAFFQAKEAGATFITKKWVAARLLIIRIINKSNFYLNFVSDFLMLLSDLLL